MCRARAVGGCARRGRGGACVVLRARHIEPPTDVHHLPCSMPDEGAPSSSRARGSKAYTAVDIGDADASETVGEMDGVPLDSKTISPHKLKSKREKGDSKPVSNLQLIVLISLALIGIGISSKVAYAMVKSNGRKQLKLSRQWR